MLGLSSRLRRLACLLFLVPWLMVSCGGSGGSGASTVTAPAITTQPASVSVAAGAAASFSVAASGSSLAYQWRKGGTAVAGANAATLTLAAASSSDAGSYDVVVSNSAGSVTSAVATLTVTGTSVAAPAITTQPVSQSVAAGASVSFTVAASGSGTLSYQWRKDGSAISGATAATLTLSSVAAADAGSYTVVVGNAGGSTPSAAATLTVTTTATGTHAAETAAAAQAFLATLGSTQKTAVQLDWSLANARRWSNLPAQLAPRYGLSWGSLGSEQKVAARTLIQTAVGATGNTMHLGWQAADNHLAANGGGSGYGEGAYYLSFVGTPSATGFWMLQLTGHHLTFNVSFNGTYKSGAPAFIGIEPKGAFTQDGATLDPMQAQREAFANLGAALTGYSGARLSGTYSDLLFGANGSGGYDNTCPRSYASVTEHGLAYGSLSAAHQALLQAAIKAYVNSQAGDVAADMLSAYLGSTALAATTVAYAGAGTVTSNGSYFRIEGPRVWIEFSVQRGVIFGNDIHYHTVWRDKLADYGGKCLE